MKASNASCKITDQEELLPKKKNSVNREIIF